MPLNVYWVVTGDLRFDDGGSPGRFSGASVWADKGVVGAGILRGHILGLAKERDIDVFGILVPELVRGEHEGEICRVEDRLNFGGHDCLLSSVYASDRPVAFFLPLSSPRK